MKTADLITDPLGPLKSQLDYPPSKHVCPILAIDPGPAQSAIVGWDGRRMFTAEIRDNKTIQSALHTLIHGKTLCIEMVSSYGMPVGREVFETVFWIGRFFQVWASATGDEPKLVYRHEIKLHHCASARAKDSNIRQALIDKYGPPGTKKQPGITYSIKSHLWAAFALATYVSETTNSTGQWNEQRILP
jgi:hypothetical protein